MNTSIYAELFVALLLVPESLVSKSQNLIKRNLRNTYHLSGRTKRMAKGVTDHNQREISGRLL